MKLTIIIPVFNEEKTILQIIEKSLKAPLPANFTREIIVVDDGSTDTTYQKLIKIPGNIKIVRHTKNMGKGAAIKTGLRLSKGDIVIIQDADLEYDPADYQRLLAGFKQKDTHAVYGSRFINYPLRLSGKYKTPMPIHWIANKSLTGLTNILYGNGITDMETGYKVIRRDLLNRLNLKSNGFDIEPEITAKILRIGIKIKEIPIRVKPRGYSEGKKIDWRDGVTAVWTLVKYRFFAE